MAIAAISIAGIQSCNKNDNNNYDIYFPNALVTVKPVSDTDFYLQLEKLFGFWNLLTGDHLSDSEFESGKIIKGHIRLV